jgi:hypothetical protein
MAHAIPDQNPGHKLDPKALRNKRFLVLGLVGVAALALLLGRRGSSAAAAQQDPNAPQGQSLDQPSTFADNGGQASQLGNDVSGQLGSFGLQMGDLSNAVQGLTDVVNTQAQAERAPADAPRADTSDPAAAAAPFLDAFGAGISFAQQQQPAGAPAGSRTAATAAKSKTVQKRSAAHGGQLSDYRVGAGGKLVYLHAASTAAKKSTGSPAGKRAPAHHTTTHTAHHAAPKKTTKKRRR